MPILTRLYRRRARCFLAAILLSACAGTELVAPSNHPGNPQARSGALPLRTALASDFGANDDGPAAPDTAHTHGASNDGPAAPDTAHTHGASNDGPAAPDTAHTHGPSDDGPAAPDTAHTHGANSGGAPTSGGTRKAVPPREQPHGAPQASDHSVHEPANTKPRAAKDADSSVVYTCPMHPEIERRKPGACPKCGMKLVPKKEKR